jgi:hypothetical protein
MFLSLLASTTLADSGHDPIQGLVLQVDCGRADKPLRDPRGLGQGVVRRGGKMRMRV